MRKRCVVVIVLGVGLVAAGCRRAEGPPAPRFTRLRVSSAGGWQVDVGGVEEYVFRYGAAGWVRGLTDDRPAGAARLGLEGAEAQRVESLLRVKDVFAVVYWRETGRRAELALPRGVSEARRDAVIERMLAEVSGGGAPGRGGTRTWGGGGVSGVRSGR